MDAAAIAEVFGTLDRELWVVTSAADGRRGGLIATFVGQASLVPERPRVLVGLARQHHTAELIESAGAFALHLIDEAQLDWVWRFGLQSGRDADKLAGLALRPGTTGAPRLADALAWLDCRVEARLDTGDRTVWLAAILDGGRLRPGAPLTRRRMWDLAPDDRRRELKAQMARDIAIDAAAIDAWRLHRGAEPPPSDERNS